MQITVATYDGATPDPLTMSGTVDAVTRAVAPGGGSFWIPPVTDNYTLQAVSYYAASGTVSPIKLINILINIGESVGECVGVCHTPFIVLL